MTSDVSANSQHVFISYARADGEFVARLIADLEAAGVNVWIDHQGLKPGTPNWEEALREAIRSSAAVMLVASPSSRRSKYVQAEIDIAQMYDHVIYPVWAVGEHWIDCVPMSLNRVQHIDLRGDGYAHGLPLILETVRAAPDVRKRSTQETPQTLPPDFTPRNPYKGLRAFREADRADFFGREALIAELVAALRDGTTPPRFLCVVGPSGSGKSSVLMAGLLPALRGGAIPGSQRWLYVDPFVPGTHPLENLAAALARLLPEKSLRAIREDLEDPSTRGLHVLGKQLATEPHQRVVLYIDQFEELFTLTATEAERQAFIDLLTTAMDEPDGQVIVLSSLRADFYDRPLQVSQLADLMERYHKVIPPLTLSDLRAVIEQPAGLDDVRLQFESGLVGELVFDVRDQVGALPLLQFTLDQLFQHREGQTLTYAAYEALGGVRGALAKHAEATYAALPSPQQQRMARALFLRLIEPGQTEQDTTRRRAEQSELTLADREATRLLRETTAAFIAARLLVSDEDTIEVAHEALIREWGRLGEWLREARDDLRLHKNLVADVTEWARRGRRADDPRLYRGELLDEAQAWADRSLPSAEEAAFLTASADRQTHDAQRERQRRRALRTTRAAVVVILFLALAAGLLGTLVSLDNINQQRDNAQTQAAAAGTEAENARVQEAIAQTERAVAQRESDNAATQAARAEIEAANAATQAAIAETNEVRAVTNEAAAQQQAETAVAAQATSQRVAGEAQSLAWYPQAQQAYEDNNQRLAYGLALNALRIDEPPALAQAALSDLLLGPGPVRRFEGHTDDVSSVAFSPDGRQVVSGSSDGSLILWDVGTGEALRIFQGHDSNVGSVAFSPDGQQVVSVSLRTLIVWDVGTGEALRTFQGHTGFVFSVALSPDGSQVVSGSSDRTLILRDVGTGAALRTLQGHELAVSSVAFSPDGRQVVSGSFDDTLILWDVGTGEALRAFQGHGSDVFSVAFSPDGSQVVSGSVDGALILWDVGTGAALRTLQGHDDGVTSVAFSPDGRQVVSGSYDDTLILWDAATGAVLRTFQGHTDAVTSVAFSPEGRQVVSGSYDTTLILWDVSTSAALRAFQGHTDAVYSVAFSPDGRQVVSGSLDTTLILWDAGTGAALRAFQGHTGFVYSVAFSPDGRQVVSGSFDDTLILWDVGTGEALRTFQGHGSDVFSVAFSPDGTGVVSGLGDGTLILWDVGTGEALRAFQGHEGEVSSVTFSPDGRQVVSGSYDTTLILWDVSTGEALRAFQGHNDLVRSVAFSPDGRQVVSGSRDNTLILWDTATAELLRTFQGHDDGVSSVAFSPDGRQVVSGSRDTMLILWDVATGEALRAFQGHEGDVWGVAFSPDGSQVVSGSDDRTLILWRVQSVAELVLWSLDNRWVRELTCAERQQYAVDPLCDEEGVYPTWTPYPTLTPTVFGSPTPLPVWTPIDTPTPTPLPVAAQVGEQEGEIAVGGGQVWTYQGAAGEVLTITTVADWDTTLTLSVEDEEIAFNDDTSDLANPLNSRIEVTLPADGAYAIGVRGYANRSGGAYTLTIESRREAAEVTATASPSPSPSPQPTRSPTPAP
jgi:WD40 repeat protein/energy-coupling factor transporter ATP-binding protein EcfA2